MHSSEEEETDLNLTCFISTEWHCPKLIDTNIVSTGFDYTFYMLFLTNK